MLENLNNFIEREISIGEYNKCMLCNIDKYGFTKQKSSTVCLTSDQLCKSDKNLNKINFELRIKEIGRYMKLKRILKEKGLYDSRN